MSVYGLSNQKKQFYSSDGQDGNLEKQISSKIGGTQKSQIQYKPERKTTQADWIGWLSQDVNFDTALDNYLSERKMEKSRTMQR